MERSHRRRWLRADESGEKMARTKLWVCFSFAILSLAGSATAGPVTLYDNLGATTDGQDGVKPAALGPLANSFSTSNTAVTLTDVKVKLVIVGQPNQTGVIEVSLQSDNGGPGVGGAIQMLGIMPDTDVGNTPKDFDLTGFTPVALAANKRYWIEIEDNNSGSNISWCWSRHITGTGVANEFFSDKNGVTANNNTLFGPYQMLVAGRTGVPEPPNVLLALAGLIGSAIMLKMRPRPGAQGSAA
jgi:hypothetical protein